MDDPTKKKQDAYTVSWQPYEIDYVVNTVSTAKPKYSKDQIRAAVESCKRTIQPSEGRDKLMACVNARLP